MEIEKNDTQAAIDAGSALAEPRGLDPEQCGTSIVGVLVPAGAQFQQIDLEKYLPRPRRKHGAITLATAQSFIDWVNRNKTPEAEIYAKESDTSFLAIFNGHAANEQPAPGTGDTSGGKFMAGPPGWGDFTARYNCPLSDEWKRWFGKSQHDVDQKKGMQHADFIQFIEDNLLDITNPPSGLLLSMARAFESKKDVKFASALRLENGDIGFNYQEESTQTGRLTLPELFGITIPVFKGGQSYEIDAKLRYRVSGGGLVLWFELIRPHKSLEHAFQQVGEQIAAGTSVPMFST